MTVRVRASRRSAKSRSSRCRAAVAAAAVLGCLAGAAPDASAAITMPIEPALASVSPAGRTGTWSLLFRDEFGGTALDRRKWITEFPWGPTSTTTPRLTYRPENVVVGDGTLKLRAARRTIEGRPYTSGMITTANAWGEPYRFTFRHGYAEIRAKLPRGKGLWPAFWLLPPDGKWPPEIDVMENIGSRPDVLEMHVHYLDDEGNARDSGASVRGPDLSRGFHTFAVEWTPSAIRWFFDGKEARAPFERARFVPDEAMYLLVNLQVGGAWPGDPDSSTVLPADFEVDYVRVWRRS